MSTVDKCDCVNQNSSSMIIISKINKYLKFKDWQIPATEKGKCIKRVLYYYHYIITFINIYIIIPKKIKNNWSRNLNIDLIKIMFKWSILHVIILVIVYIWQTTNFEKKLLFSVTLLSGRVSWFTYRAGKV